MNAPGVIGTGIDLVENARMRKMLERWGSRFKDKVFLPSEQEYCDSKASPWLYYSGRFAVKEAVSKAFGTGIGEHLNWLNIEVAKEPSTGAPFVRLNGPGNALLESRGAADVLVSMSHTHNFAIAQALLVASALPRDTER